MLKINAMEGSAAGKYYVSLAVADYYVNGGEPPGQWFGKGAPQLGLEGKVEAAPLRNVLLGFSADGGKKLVQNAGSQRMQTGWDLTFTTPKSLAVLWGMSDSNTQKVIQSCNMRAAKHALSWLEANHLFTRRGAQGRKRERVSLVAALFEHGSSRALDPLLHIHALVLSRSPRRDSKTGTIVSRLIYRNIDELDRKYLAELERLVRQELKLDVRKTENGFEIDGVPSYICKHFSKRREQIIDYIKKFGVYTPKVAQIAAFETRLKKEVLPRRVLFERWREKGIELGFGPDEARELLNRSRKVEDHKESQAATPLEENRPGEKLRRDVGAKEHLGLSGRSRDERRKTRDKSKIQDGKGTRRNRSPENLTADKESSKLTVPPEPDKRAERTPDGTESTIANLTKRNSAQSLPPKTATQESPPWPDERLSDSTELKTKAKMLQERSGGNLEPVGAPDSGSSFNGPEDTPPWPDDYSLVPKAVQKYDDIRNDPDGKIFERGEEDPNFETFNEPHLNSLDEPPQESPPWPDDFSEAPPTNASAPKAQSKSRHIEKRDQKPVPTPDALTPLEPSILKLRKLITILPKIITPKNRLHIFGQSLFRIPLTKLEVRRTERRLFRDAPEWSPFSKFKRLAIVREFKPLPKRPKMSIWAGQKSFGPITIDMEKKLVAPDAPSFSPLYEVRAKTLTISIRPSLRSLAALRDALSRKHKRELDTPRPQHRELIR